MKREVEVRLKRGMKGATLIFMFNDGNDKKVLSRATGRIVLYHEMTGGDEIHQINLHPTNSVYRIGYEDDKNYKDADNDKYKELARLFKCGQYQTLVVKSVNKDGTYEYEDNKVLQVHQFDYIDETQNRIQNVVTQKRINRAISIVDSLSVSQQKEVLFHFNQDPTKMSASEIWMRLINQSSGIVLNRDKYDEVDLGGGKKKSRSYLEYFVDEYSNQFADEESDVYLKTLILRALIVKKDDMRTVIERRNTGYYLGEKTLGAELHNVINFLRSNVKEREHVKATVSKYDEVPHNDIPQLLEARGIKFDNSNVIEEKERAVFMAAENQQHRRNLDAARNTFRMVVEDDIDPTKLEEMLEVARGVWGNGKFWKIGEILENNPDANYEEIKELIKKAKANRKVAREKEKVETASS